MSDDRRDDSNLMALICPHCKMTSGIYVPRIGPCQLLYAKCEHCDQGITKQQIDDTYREYRIMNRSEE